MKRLKKRRQFLAVAREKQNYVAPFFILQYGSIASEACAFGFTVSKKVGGAVVRNRVRRRLKEVVRLCEKEHGTDLFLPQHYVLVGRKACLLAPFHALQQHFFQALKTIRQKHEKEISAKNGEKAQESIQEKTQEKTQGNA